MLQEEFSRELDDFRLEKDGSAPDMDDVSGNYSDMAPSYAESDHGSGMEYVESGDDISSIHDEIPDKKNAW